MSSSFTRTIAASALVAAMAVAGPAPRSSAQTIDMKIGFASIGAPEDEITRRFVAEIDAKSGGRIKGRAFPASQLGGIPRMIEGVQLGTQEIWIGPPGFLVGLNPGFSTPDAPGLFDDVEHSFRSVTDASFRDRYTRLGEDKGVVLAMVSIYDPTWIASHDPIRRLSDLRGKKVRVIASKMEIELVGALGATGVPIPFNEVIPALQSRTIDAVRSSIIVLGASKAFTVVKNITYEGSAMIPIAMVTSKTWLDKLPADLRELVLATGRAHDRVGTDICSEFRIGAEKLWRDNGASVVRFPADEQQALLRTVTPLGDRILGEDPRVKELYEILKASAAKNKRSS